MTALHAPKCETCGDSGVVSRYASPGREPWTLEEGPCPEPGCEAGAEEFAAALRNKRATNLHPIFRQALAPFMPKDDAA